MASVSGENQLPLPDVDSQKSTIGVQGKRRPRAPNFTDAEKDLLVDVVIPFKGVIECNETNKKSNDSKTEAWEAIASNFNAQNGTKRAPTALRSLYSMLKSTVKKDVANRKVKFLLFFITFD